MNGRMALGIGLLVIFAVITAMVVSGATQGFDAWLALSVNGAYLGQSATTLMVIASEYGREFFWIPIVALMLLFGKRDMKVLAVELAILFIIGIVAGELMKYAMYRPRPFDTVHGITTRVPISTDSSYPSGHALIVSIGAIFVLTKFVKSRRGRVIAGLLAFEAALVMYSRVYVGMHYPIDVIAGLVLAGAIVFIAMPILERHTRLLGAPARLAEKILKRLHFPEVF